LTRIAPKYIFRGHLVSESRVASSFVRCADYDYRITARCHAKEGHMAYANRFSIPHRLIAFALAIASAVASAQSPPPLAQPNVPLLTNGSVNAIVRTSDGGVIVGGDFTEIGGVARSNLARFNADGTLDAAWNASTNGPVAALALDPNDTLFVGGLFDDASGEHRFCLAKFSAAGDVDVNWTAFADAPVLAIAVADGAVYVGGYFMSVTDESRTRLAKLSPDGAGALDETWLVPASGRVIALQAGASGTLYVAGAFQSIGGESTSYLAKVSTSGAGAVDTTWTPAPDDWVMALAYDGTSLYTAGYFTSIGGEALSHLARVDAGAGGDADATWAPDLDEVSWAVSLGTDDSVYVGGFFHTVGGVARSHVAKVSTQGAGDAVAAWDASTDGRVFTVATDGGGHTYIGGTFSQAAGVARHSLAQVSATSGAPATAFDATEAGKAFAFALQPNGGAIVGGRFFEAGGQPRVDLLRLRADGTLDPNWTPSIASSDDSGAQLVGALAVDASGDVYVGGAFDHVNGTARGYLAKVDGDSGNLDPTWNPSADAYVDALALDGNGALFAGGQFTQVGGLARNFIAKMSANGAGAVDPAWDPSADYYVYDLALDAQGAVYAGGDFSFIGGETRTFAAKLAGDGTGAADPDWDAGADSTVWSLIPDNAGSVFAGGWFFDIGGQPRVGLAKLDATNAAADATWNPATGFGASINAMALDGDALYVGGLFSELGGISIASLGKLSTTGAGDPDAAFNPGVNGGPNGSEGLLNLTIGNGVVYVGGGFTEIGGAERDGIAALPISTVVLPDEIFADGFDDGSVVAQPGPGHSQHASVRGH
jgi:beta-propeller uncharacterized protein DUF5122